MLKCSQFSGWNSQSPFFFNEEIKCGSTFHKINTNSIVWHEDIDDFSFAEINVHTQMLCILSQLALARTIWKTK